MAEIPIRRKEGRNVWPLLLGLLVLAAVLWFVVVRHPTTTTATRPDSAAIRDSARLRADSVAAAQASVTKMDTSKLGKMDTSKLNAAHKKGTTEKKKGY